MFYRYELDPDNDLNMDFDDLLKKAMALLGAKKKLASLVQVEKKSQEVEDLVEKCDYKTRISSIPNCPFMQSPISTFQPLIPPTHTPVQTGRADYQPVDKKINHLTEMMRVLALSVRNLQNNTGPSDAENNRHRPLSASSSNLSQPSILGSSFQSDWS